MPLMKTLNKREPRIDLGGNSKSILSQLLKLLFILTL